MNRDQAIIASICYFSVFFMPFLLPIVAYFIVDQPETKRHARRAFLSHLLPFVAMLILIVMTIILGVTVQTTDLSILSVMTIGVSSILVLISFLIVTIWNIIQGIKVLQSNEL
ncbi:hypothetical protein [Bacillus sp. NPDC077027]|uniref:hypothetical protein n=1 Tax=Bacillus sp. NPDC077027 TaxID=3390548 RepID=UPI003D0595BB